MLFSVNEVIDFKETGLYITDRFVVIPFNATFTDDNNNRDINIGDKLCNPLSLQIIATKSLQAFNRVIKNGKFTIPPIVQEATNKYFLDCNNVVEFCSLFPIKTFIIKTQYYEEYCKWCNSNNKQAVSNSQFGKQVLSLGFRAERYSFEGKRNTYYANSSFNNDRSSNVYNAFLCDKEEKLIKNSMTFEEYLCYRLYRQ